MADVTRECCKVESLAVFAGASTWMTLRTYALNRLSRIHVSRNKESCADAPHNVLGFVHQSGAALPQTLLLYPWVGIPIGRRSCAALLARLVAASCHGTPSAQDGEYHLERVQRTITCVFRLSSTPDGNGTDVLALTATDKDGGELAANACRGWRQGRVLRWSLRTCSLAPGPRRG